MNSNFFSKIFGGILLLALCVAPEIPAQQNRGGGFGGFGGFGAPGFGGNAGGTRSSASSSSQFNNNGTVGTATFAVDPDTHNIIVIADEETAKQISQVITNLDRPKQQVLIKVVFMEVQHNDSSEIGVEGGVTRNAFISQLGTNVVVNGANVFGLSGLNSIATNFNAVGQSSSFLSPMATGAFSGGSGGLYQILGSDFQATLRAIAQAGKAEVLSRPSILARDGQLATIVIGQSVPLVTSVSYSGLANTPVNNITYTDVGIILKVTPFISADGKVEMIIQPSISSVDPTLTQTISPGVTAPYLDVRSADTVVVTPDLQTVVIGGLIANNKSSSESKIPFLGDIPLLGNLFKSKSKSAAKQELLIFLTPHIVSEPTELASYSSNERNSTFAPKSYSEAELDRFLDKLPAKPAAKTYTK